MESKRLRGLGVKCVEKGGEMAGKRSTEAESGESSTEEESPRSVVMKKKMEWVHSQVLRIREEESYLGEDFISGPAVVVGGSPKPHRVNLVLLTRPILPCSPLSGKNAVRALH